MVAFALSLFQSVHNKKIREQARVAVDVILCIARDRNDAQVESRRIVCADRRSRRARAGREIEPLYERRRLPSPEIASIVV